MTCSTELNQQILERLINLGKFESARSVVVPSSVVFRELTFSSSLDVQAVVSVSLSVLFIFVL